MIHDSVPRNLQVSRVEMLHRQHAKTTPESFKNVMLFLKVVLNVKVSLFPRLGVLLSELTSCRAISLKYLALLPKFQKSFIPTWWSEATSSSQLLYPLWHLSLLQLLLLSLLQLQLTFLLQGLTLITFVVGPALNFFWYSMNFLHMLCPFISVLPHTFMRRITYIFSCVLLHIIVRRRIFIYIFDAAWCIVISIVTRVLSHAFMGSIPSYIITTCVVPLCRGRNYFFFFLYYHVAVSRHWKRNIPLLMYFLY